MGSTKWVILSLVLANIVMVRAFTLNSGPHAAEPEQAYVQPWHDLSHAARFGTGPRAFPELCSFVDRQIVKYRCTARELGSQRVGWVRDLDTAFSLSRRTGRPLFVLDGDGNICTGRL